MRIVMIHKGPSSECECELCRDDAPVHPGVTFQYDTRFDAQGRSPEQQQANERIAVWLFKAGVVLAVAVVVWLVAS